MALASTAAADRLTPRVLSGSASPTRPARSLSRASSGLILLKDARSAASLRMPVDIPAALSCVMPIATKRFPNVPADSYACCLLMPRFCADVFARSSITPIASPNTTFALFADSSRLLAALMERPPMIVSGAVNARDIIIPVDFIFSATAVRSKCFLVLSIWESTFLSAFWTDFIDSSNLSIRRIRSEYTPPAFNASLIATGF